MTELKDRIKQIRKGAGLTQQEFAARAGISYSALAAYEASGRQPSTAAVTAICRTFGVNPEWLRTGDGEPYEDRTENDRLHEFVEKAIGDRMDNDFKWRFLKALRGLTEDEWLLLERIVTELAAEQTEQSESAKHVIALYAEPGDDDDADDRHTS